MSDHDEMMWHEMSKHPFYHKVPKMAPEVAHWANQRARGPPLSELDSRQKWSATGDQSEMELGGTMESPMWYQDPSIRCFHPNSKHEATDPDFVCPFNRSWDIELKTSSERSGDIRGGGVSHPRKKSCYYIHMRLERRSHHCYSVRMGWVRPDDWTKSGKWLRAECRDRFVEIYNPQLMKADEVRRAAQKLKRAKRQENSDAKALKLAQKKKVSDALLAQQPTIFEAFRYGEK